MYRKYITNRKLTNFDKYQPQQNLCFGNVSIKLLRSCGGLFNDGIEPAFNNKDISLHINWKKYIFD